MRSYTVVTPLRRNGKLIPAGKTVELDEAEGNHLADIGALERGALVKPAAPPPPPPAPPLQPQPPKVEPGSLEGKDADQLRAIAKEEGVRLNPNVKDPAKIAAAIEQARAGKA